jgi:hypothetical protein
MDQAEEELKDRPREPPGSVRRDCEPHRGPELVVLGTVSLVCGVLSWCCLPSSLVGLPLGIAVWVLSERDLSKMRAGMMDPGGKAQTERSFNRGLYGMALSGLSWVFCGPLAYNLAYTVLNFDF